MSDGPSQKQCKMHPCENLISARSKHDLCHNCRNRLEFWAKRSPTHFLARKLTLQVWANRMDYVREEKRDQYAPFKKAINGIEAKPEGLPRLTEVIKANKQGRAARKAALQ
jgi:hypothetical protein